MTLTAMAEKYNMWLGTQWRRFFARLCGYIFVSSVWKLARKRNKRAGLHYKGRIGETKPEILRMAVVSVEIR